MVQFEMSGTAQTLRSQRGWLRILALATPLTVGVLLGGLLACRAPVSYSPRDHPADDAIGVRGAQFLALSVAQLDGTSRWYASTFGLDTITQWSSADSAVRTQLLGSRSLMVELSQHRSARTLRDYAGGPTPTFLVHGFFKGGIVVANVDQAVLALGRRGVAPATPARTDTATGMRFVLVRDPEGNFLHLLEWLPPSS